MSDSVFVDPRPVKRGPDLSVLYDRCAKGQHAACVRRVFCQRNKKDHIEVGYDTCSCPCHAETAAAPEGTRPTPAVAPNAVGVVSSLETGRSVTTTPTAVGLEDHDREDDGMGRHVRGLAQKIIRERDAHRCHATGCETKTRPELLMCPIHWRMVPKTLQAEVWKHYREGQCDDKSPSRAWCEAADAAINAVATLDGRNQTPLVVDPYDDRGYTNALKNKEAAHDVIPTPPAVAREVEPPRDRPPTTFTPTEDQAKALELLASGCNVFLTGVAGTGKSTTLQTWMRQSLARIAVTASTGIAALNVGGRTVHSWVGLRPGSYDAKAIAEGERWQRSTRWVIRRAEALVIDEVSMIDSHTLDVIEELCRRARSDEPETAAPWGGLQTVLVGDLGQLPPVELEARGFCFQARAFQGFVTAELRQVMRQSDAAFVRVLQEVRLGRLSEEGRKLLGSRVRAFDPDDPKTPAVRLATHNAQVDAINARKLAELPGEVFTFKADDKSKPHAAGMAALARIQKDCLSPAELRLRVGARVMLTRNAPTGHLPNYVNGSTGTVIELTPHRVRVRLDAGGEFDPQRQEWTVEGSGPNDVLASRSQLPLRLGWAASIHKSQGLTLERVSVDLAKAFAPGQAYVALSRCRTLEGLNVEAWREDASIFAHPMVLAFLANAQPTEGPTGEW